MLKFAVASYNVLNGAFAEFFVDDFGQNCVELIKNKILELKWRKDKKPSKREVMMQLTIHIFKSCASSFISTSPRDFKFLEIHSVT